MRLVALLLLAGMAACSIAPPTPTVVPTWTPAPTPTPAPMPPPTSTPTPLPSWVTVSPEEKRIIYYTMRQLIVQKRGDADKFPTDPDDIPDEMYRSAAQYLGMTLEAQIATPTPTATPLPTPTSSPIPSPYPTPTPTASPTPTPIPAPRLEPTATATPTLEPIVASKAAWDCFFDRTTLSLPDEFPLTRCGWYGPPDTWRKRGNILFYAIEGGNAAWIKATDTALRNIADLAGIQFILAQGPHRSNPHLLVQLRDVAYVDCGGLLWKGCALTGYFYDEPGRIAIATRGPVSVRLIEHEILHILHFGHAPTGIMRTGKIGTQDREMLALYKALPQYLSETQIRERACIGANGICARPYVGRF